MRPVPGFSVVGRAGLRDETTPEPEHVESLRRKTPLLCVSLIRAARRVGQLDRLIINALFARL